MSQPSLRTADPFIWHCAIACAFFALALVRLGTPSAPYFDEVHYLPAARSFFEMQVAQNLEHPPLAKQIMALGMAVFGDLPFGWRIMSAVFGTLALFASMRATWLTGRARGASVLTGVFVSTNFLLFVQARIAMLDVFMAGFVMLALWMCVGAIRQNETARWRLAIAGTAMGAAMASKWNAIPLAMLPGLTFLSVRISAARWSFLIATRAAPVHSMALWEAALWLGALPLAVYWAAYLPYAMFADQKEFSGGIAALHQQMLALQTQVLDPHHYQSVWWQWAANHRAIWYLYEDIDGAQRAIMLIGNPLTMLAGLAALAWCVWAGLKDARRDCLGVAILYIASLALWMVAPKAVQFYFHYFLSAMFLSGALALAMNELWQRGKRIVPAAIVIGAMGFFVYWFPALTAAPLGDPQDFLRWAWFESWR